MFADRTVLFRGLPLVVAALAFLFAPAAWTQTASCTAGNPNANLLQTTPTADFDATATDGTVIHTKTRLMWKRCAEGQTWEDATPTCTGTASGLNWQNALAAANSTFAGYTDWRLPNVKELQSIVESCGFIPAINQIIFPATPASFFWSASSYGPIPAGAWVVGFYVGDVYADVEPGVNHVRLVRGGQSFDSFDLFLGAVTVSKTVTGAAAASVPAGTNFPITLTCGTTTLGPLNATTATPAVFTNVPLESCTVAEGTLPTIAGVTWGTPAFAPSATVTVTAGASTPVTVTNTANQTFTGPTATGTGDATATVSSGGDTCGFTNAQFVAVSVVPAAPPPGYSFPHGLFDFTLANCTPGGTVTLTITYPSALPTGTVYWKYGPTPSNASPDWYQMPATISGNTVTFSITDGGLGDDDLTANGAIVDQGGPGVPGVPGGAGATTIPTLSEWAMLALMSLLLGYGGWRLRRKGSF